MKNIKQERNSKVIELLRTQTISEVAKLFSISKQRVKQIADYYGATIYRGRWGKSKRALSEIGSMPDIVISAKYAISSSQVSWLRKKYNLPKFPRQIKKIGCVNCETNPYARGLCRNCYCRQRRLLNAKAHLTPREPDGGESGKN